MHDPEAHAILQRIEDAGYTVSRSRTIDGQTTVYRLSAWRPGRPGEAVDDKRATAVTVEADTRLAAAQALACAVDIDAG